jgi:hypothetical protein
MDMFKSFATDDNLEVNGAWHKGTGNTEWLIARAQNRKYQRLLAKTIEENQELLESKTDESDARSEEIMAEIYAETILLGWKGDVEYNKEKLEYSKANAKKLCLMKEFRRWVAKKSDDLDAYRAKVEAEQGNV